MNCGQRRMTVCTWNEVRETGRMSVNVKMKLVCVDDEVLMSTDV